MLELGYANIGLFHLNGDIAALRKGDSLVNKASEKLNHTLPNIQQALSQIAITQHRFRDAMHHLKNASQKGSPYINAILNFDARMEVGEFEVAHNQINGLGDKESFDYLIRKSKFADHQGNLDEAIKLMEQAFEKVKDANVKSVYCWALSNLGDMYGHAGRIKDSYKAYLQVLEKDPSYLYALKGIAWIAYSHDKNTAEAKRILNFILSQTDMPDLYLTLAEIEEFEGNKEAAEKYVSKFLTAMQNPAYGEMHNKYLVEVYASQNRIEEAFQIANKEVANRPTPETYSWLSWMYLLKGEKAKALSIYQQHVAERSFEPEVLYKGALVLSANNKKAEAKKLFEECLNASYELGPVMTEEIRKEMDKL
jgi:tetratricopeptide (TPR) repeat protein